MALLAFLTFRLTIKPQMAKVSLEEQPIYKEKNKQNYTLSPEKDASACPCTEMHNF